MDFRLPLVMALPCSGGFSAMTHTTNSNSVQKSLCPMLLTWTRCISWTVLLSALLAVLFALVCDGCSGAH